MAEFSPRRFAEILDETGINVPMLSAQTGISKATLYDYKKGSKRPGSDSLSAIAEATGRSMEAFFDDYSTYRLRGRTAEIVGPRIRRARLERNLTEAQLGGLINVTADIIMRWEDGREGPTIQQCLKLSKALDREQTWFFQDQGWQDKAPPKFSLHDLLDRMVQQHQVAVVAGRAADEPLPVGPGPPGPDPIGEIPEPATANPGANDGSTDRSLILKLLQHHQDTISEMLARMAESQSQNKSILAQNAEVLLQNGKVLAQNSEVQSHNKEILQVVKRLEDRLAFIERKLEPSDDPGSSGVKGAVV
jgi:transcriptional regulator with XRE-family HTH domain